MDNRELAAVLAALRHWQATRADVRIAALPRVGGELAERNAMLIDIETYVGMVEPLSDAEIDALCERLNTQPAAQITITARSLRDNQMVSASSKRWFTLDLEAPTPIHAADQIAEIGAALDNIEAAAGQVLIWSFEHNGWWAPGRQGYVSDVDSAGRYFLAEARQIVEIANIAAINEAIVLLPRNRVPAQRPTGTKEERR